MESILEEGKMEYPHRKRLERLFLLAVWLLGCYILWSPHTGARISSQRAERTEFGFAGYYTVTLTHNNGSRVERFERSGLLATVIGTAIWSLYFAWVWRRGNRRAVTPKSADSTQREVTSTISARQLE